VRKQAPFAATTKFVIARERMNGTAGRKLLLPGALLVAIQAQLLAPFMLVDLCLAAFFD
jgi:hypothetical protein